MPTETTEEKKQSVKVNIMKREFTVACGIEETEGLVEAAAYLDKQMRAITKGSQILTVDRCAIMAGLNITYSLLQLQKVVSKQEQMISRLQSLHDQIDVVVNNQGVRIAN